MIVAAPEMIAELHGEARRVFARLLRVQRKTFAGDTLLINGTISGEHHDDRVSLAARTQTRQEFEAGRKYSNDLEMLRKVCQVEYRTPQPT